MAGIAYHFDVLASLPLRFYGGIVKIGSEPDCDALLVGAQIDVVENGADTEPFCSACLIHYRTLLIS
ncbi:hypothetical protein OG824_28035 [Streptomyces prunicolor]|uniref:hypothetical protein n=1 Tax=Streptomyces prunicolor TaxID=67348 RepID=UPI00225A39C9|nr:hypothetical protein [Streptomyces prunicolor]MCX5239054.1 hypothetical protein [Streptomyces prunicolor]